MSRIPLIVLLLSTFVLACASGGGDPDGGDQDGTGNGDQFNSDSQAPEVIDCELTVTKCPAGLDCRCCGSIGPQPICICSAQCYGDSDCEGTGFTFCNMREGAKSGICTPLDFNCCWDCQ